MSAFKVDLWRAQIIMLTHEEPASHTRLEHPPSGAWVQRENKNHSPSRPDAPHGLQPGEGLPTWFP